MSEPLDETALAAHLCSNLLNAPQVKQLCFARGFPVASGAKEAVARSAAARLLDPVGVAEAMAWLEPVWLKALHLIAASREPIGLPALRQLVDPGDNRWNPDWRALWRKVAAGLASRGVILAVDHAATWGHRSRFSHLRLVLPETFRPFLPPYPLDTSAVSGSGDAGALDDMLKLAIAAFVASATTGGKSVPRTTAERVAAQIRLKDGLLQLEGGAVPTAEHLVRVVVDAWRGSLPTGGKYEPPIEPGVVAHHILTHLAAGSGCSPAAMVGALGELGLAVKPENVAEYLDEGRRAGLLQRFGRSGAPPLFRVAPTPPLPAGTPFELKSDQAGRCVASSSCALLPLLQAATVSRVSLDQGRLLLEPDPIRMGRCWRELPAAVASRLRAASKAFDDAARMVESRSGQVVVHLDLAVLRVEDAGLYALLCKRFPSAVRKMESPFLACLTGTLEELVAAAKKEGFVARRLS
ncbi:MAG: hypothetical protein HY898_23270 [Deltaproteobacteria bacterium]|nr:hypothetical protein [Deltaproteobacteria bacterium]